MGFDAALRRLRPVGNAPTAESRSSPAPVPLHADRRYHLVATMTSGPGWTNLTGYANWNVVAWTNDSGYTAWDGAGTEVPNLGYDATSGTRLAGVIDEFRLYKTSLTQDGVRALMWFLKGSNSILIPRGILYDSLLFPQMTSPSGSDLLNGPLAGANVHGNSNNLSSNLNSPVIRMVITKNVTLAQAWAILDLARTNKSGNVMAFPFFATSEFYTLGFAWEVTKLAANTSVVNGGNFSAPPPPPSAWQLFWNAIAGWAERAWNAAVAVGAFFVNVGKWLVQAALAYVKGLTTGDWTDFQNKVLKPLIDALNALVNSILALVRAAIDAAIKALLSPFELVKARVAGIFGEFTMAVGRYQPTGVKSEFSRFSEMMLNFYADALIVLTLLGVALVAAAFITLPVSFIAGTVITLVLGMMLTQLFSGLAPKTMAVDAAGTQPLESQTPARQFVHTNTQGEEDAVITLFLEILSASFGIMALWLSLKVLDALKDPSGILAVAGATTFVVMSIVFGLWLNSQPVSNNVRDIATGAIAVVLLAISILGLILDLLLLPRELPKPWMKFFVALSLIFSGISILIDAHLLGVV